MGFLISIFENKAKINAENTLLGYLPLLIKDKSAVVVRQKQELALMVPPLSKVKSTFPKEINKEYP